ncbi:hypothetical protein DUGA6_63000 [Duganella sp. HH105]|nr:hypothetical protein DUGA6_63000 [Duganella sp. HH105]
MASRSACGSSDRSCTSSDSSSTGAITCTGVPSTLAKLVRSASCRRTISLTVRRNAATSSAPLRRTAAGMLYSALADSNWSMNHRRCCANDSGNATSRPTGAIGGALRPRCSDSIRASSPAAVGASNTTRSGSSTSNALRICDTSCVASSE